MKTLGSDLIILIVALFVISICYMIIRDIKKYKEERRHFEKTLKAGMLVDTWHKGKKVPTRIKVKYRNNMIMTQHGLRHVKQIMKRG